MPAGFSVETDVNFKMCTGNADAKNVQGNFEEQYQSMLGLVT